MAGNQASRRTFLGGAATAGLATGLAGCTFGQVTGAGGTTVVQLAAASGSYQAQSDINEALHEAGMPRDVRVSISVVGSSQAQSQYTRWLSAGLEKPDLLRMDSGWTIPFILREQIANLSESMPDVAQRIKDEYFQASVDTVTAPNGDVHGVPLFSDFGLVLYRKDLVEEAGFDPSGWATSPLSWKRFAEVAKQTKDRTDAKHGFTFQAMVYEGLSCCDFNEFMTTWGGSYFGARKNLLENVGERPVTVDADPVVKANRMLRTFIQGPDDSGALEEFAGPISPSAVLTWSEDPSLSAFTNGDAVMHRNWPYSLSVAGAEDAFGTNLGVMPIPYGVRPGEAQFAGMGGTKSALGGWHVTMNPNTKRKDAAREVLRAMTRDSFNVALMNILGYVPPKPDLLTSKQARSVDVLGRYVDQLELAGQNAVPRPATVVWPLQSPRIAQQVSAALSGDKSPNGAMNDLRRILEDIEHSAREGR